MVKFFFIICPAALQVGQLHIHTDQSGIETQWNHYLDLSYRINPSPELRYICMLDDVGLQIHILVLDTDWEK